MCSIHGRNGIFSLHFAIKFNHMIGKSTIRGMVWESDVIICFECFPKFAQQ